MLKTIADTPFITSEEVVFTLRNNAPRHRPEEVLDMSGIEVNSFDELYAQNIAEATIYNYHRGSFYHVFRFTGAGNVHFIENKKITLNNDCILIINRDILHKYSKNKCKGDMVLFTNTFLNRTPEKADFLNNSTLFQNNYAVIPLQSEELINTVDSYFSLMKNIQPKGKTKVAHTGVLRNWLYILLINIERQYRLRNSKLSDQYNHKAYILQFKTLLDTHYQTEKQVSFYAKKLQVSEKKLSQIVYNIHGFCAKTLINEKVLLEALLLLKNTTLNQGEIAQRLGFDFTYFIKFFRKHTGTTPTKYRQKINNQ